MKTILLILISMVLITGAVPCTTSYHPDSHPVLLDSPLLYQLPWNTLETPHFTIYYRESHTILARKVAELSESVYDDATSFMRFNPSQKVDIVILPSTSHVLPWDSSFANRGYANGEERSFTLFYGCPFSTEVFGLNYLDTKRIIAHELTHVLLYGVLEDTVYISGLYSTHQWISEGIATYYEKHSCASLREDDLMLPVIIEYLEDEGKFPRFLEEISISNLDRLAYPLACSVIEFMIDRWGEETFFAFLDSLKKWESSASSTQNVDRALKEAFGKTKSDFEKEWGSYVREKYPGSEEQEIEAAQITDPPGWRAVSSWHGSTILFVSDTEGNLDIFSVNTSLKTMSQLTQDESSDFDPKYSPDGKKIAFTSLRDGYAHIYCMDADGSDVVQVTSGEFMDVMGSWSSDGKRIAFTSNRSGNYDIYVMDAFGSAMTQVTTYEGEDGGPVFAPDGRILFVSDRDGDYDLYVMNSDGTGIYQLTNTPEYENFPQYSPDGKKIAFVSRWETKSEICIMNNDGTERKTIFTPPDRVVDPKARHRDGILGYPVWAPDGKKIAFTAVNQVFTIAVPEETTGRVLERQCHWVILVLGIGVSCVFLGLKKYVKRRDEEPS